MKKTVERGRLEGKKPVKWGNKNRWSGRVDEKKADGMLRRWKTEHLHSF
jgi:hypothetical protein